MVLLVRNKEANYSRIEVEEEVGQTQQCERQRTISSQRALYVTLLIGLSMLTFFAGQYTSHMGQSPVPRSPIPYVPTETVTFQPDPKFSGPSSQDSDIAWTSLMPPGEGFVVVQDPERYNLPRGKNSTSLAATAALYDISAFHQLHCLTKIREHVSLLQYAIRNEVDRAWENVLKPQEDHMGHCFDYLRQGIMCAGDMTLEWPKEGTEGVVDGWGVTHQCKSWGAISKYVHDYGVEPSAYHGH